MTGLRREGAHLEEQPGKGSGRSLDRAEELGAGVPAPANWKEWHSREGALGFIRENGGYMGLLIGARAPASHNLTPLCMLSQGPASAQWDCKQDARGSLRECMS